MLTITNDDNQSKCFKFIGMESSPKTTHLLANNTSLLSPSVECSDTCSFYSGPSDATIISFGESCESSGAIAYSGNVESCGSIAFAGGGESCGSIASVSSGVSSFSGGGCSYSC